MPIRKHSKHATHTKRMKHTKSKKTIPSIIPIMSLIKHITADRKRLTKSQTNLPAKLNSLSSHHRNPKPNITSVNIQPANYSYAKTISSTFSSVVHNGKAHSEGKIITNESTKPFLNVKEMHNGEIEHFIIPKNTIKYKPSKAMMKTLKKSRKHSSHSKHIQSSNKLSNLLMN